MLSKSEISHLISFLIKHIVVLAVLLICCIFGASWVANSLNRVNLVNIRFDDDLINCKKIPVCQFYNIKYLHDYYEENQNKRK